MRAPLLLVVNQGSATVSLVDPQSDRTTATIQEGVPSMFGHEVAVSGDGRFAYVPLYSDVGLGKPGSNGDTILVLDIANARISRKLSFGHGVRPHLPVLDRATGLLYVTTELEKAVTVIDTKTMTIVGAVPTGAEQSHMLVISRDGHTGYTANVSSGTISVLDLQKRTLVRKIPVAPTIQRIAISPDDKTLVTADQSSPRLAFIDTATGSVHDWVTLPTLGYGSAFSKDGTMLLVTLPATGQVVAIDVAGKHIVHTIDVGPHPQAVLIRPDGKRAYVSCLGSNYVSVVDLATWQVVDRIETGQKADGMAWLAR
ncbi:MAG TPA: beta-propeller fold lactonase family protein [Acidobacteriaceae bacterium]